MVVRSSSDFFVLLLFLVTFFQKDLTTFGKLSNQLIYDFFALAFSTKRNFAGLVSVITC